MRFFILTILFFQLGCEQNPYPEDAIVVREELTKEEPTYAISAVFPETLDLLEGEEFRFRLEIREREDESVSVQVKGLPEGATYDEETREISWTPSMTDGDNIRSQNLGYRAYPLEIFIQGTVNTQVGVTKKITLIVYDRLQDFSIQGNNQIEVSEGSEFDYEFTLSDEEFLEGPFEVGIHDFPYDLVLSHNERTKVYQISGKAAYNWTDQEAEVFSFEIVAINPKGQRVVQNVDLKVLNTPQGLVIDGPTRERSSEGSVSFLFRDKNNSEVPTFTVVNTLDEKLEYNLSSFEFPSDALLIQQLEWNYTGENYQDVIIPVEYRVCNAVECADRTFTITVPAKPQPIPPTPPGIPVENEEENPNMSHEGAL